jgi:carbon catabolite-derepressing protein kinase
MEIMLVLYKTLQDMGIEWKEKRNLGGLGGIQRKLGPDGRMDFFNLREQALRNGGYEPPIDTMMASQIYFIETRWRDGNCVLLMNIQLYVLEPPNYILDFHHQGTYLATSREGAGKYDPATEEEKRAILNKFVDSDRPRMDTDAVVMSPYTYMNMVSRLIIELSGAGEEEARAQAEAAVDAAG